MITQAHIISMERVDEIKISPHEPVVAIHASQPALQNAAPRIKFPPRREAAALQRFGFHAARLKRNAVVTVALIQPPAFIEQTSLALQSRVERGARERREMVERGDV